MSFTTIDIVFSVVIAVAAIRGIVKGFIEEFFSVGALVLGVLLATLFSSALAGPVEDVFKVRGWGQVIAFFAIFIVVYIVLKLVERGLKGVFEKINLQNLDRALGFLLGLLEGVVVVSVVIVAIRIQPFFKLDELLQGSFYARYILPLVLAAAGSIDPAVKNVVPLPKK
jgi:membrane protein required for colicin V production